MSGNNISMLMAHSIASMMVSHDHSAGNKWIRRIDSARQKSVIALSQYLGWHMARGDWVADRIAKVLVPGSGNSRRRETSLGSTTISAFNRASPLAERSSEQSQYRE